MTMKTWAPNEIFIASGHLDFMVDALRRFGVEANREGDTMVYDSEEMENLKKYGKIGMMPHLLIMNLRDL